MFDLSALDDQSVGQAIRFSKGPFLLIINSVEQGLRFRCKVWKGVNPGVAWGVSRLPGSMSQGATRLKVGVKIADRTLVKKPTNSNEHKRRGFQRI